jgi:hypothetical protein
MSTSRTWAVSTLIDRGIGVAERLETLADAAVERQAAPGVSREADGYDRQEVDRTPGRSTWLTRLDKLRPNWKPVPQDPSDTYKSLDERELGQIHRAADTVVRGVMQLQPGARLQSHDPFDWAAGFLPALERGRKALEGTLGEGVISRVYLGQLREYLQPHAEQRLKTALALVDSRGALTRTLEKAATEGWQVSGSLTEVQHGRLMAVHEQLQQIRSLEDPAEKARRIPPLHRDLGYVFAMRSKLSDEVGDDLTQWMKVLRPVKIVLELYPQLIGK